MRLHAGADARGLLARWHGWLAVDGVLMFSCLGPDTLRELRALYAQAGWPPPAQDFVDMHDWGDRLVHAGFSGPVMDVERLTLTWPSPSALLTELRGLGRNLHPARYAGLRTPRWRERLLRALAERAGTDGRIAMSFEIVYGHAIKPAPRRSNRKPRWPFPTCATCCARTTLAGRAAGRAERSLPGGRGQQA
jgi:malonyl-CoA O-methyltransferase